MEKHILEFWVFITVYNVNSKQRGSDLENPKVLGRRTVRRKTRTIGI